MKTKIAIFALSCCEGCECVVLEYAREFLKTIADVELIEERLLEDNPLEWNDKSCQWQISFVEGSAITPDNLKLLKKIRECSRYLVVLGNCAQFGGIHKMKTYRGKDKLVKILYKYPETVPNLEIKDMDEQVAVDFVVPTCPINGEEFLRIANDLIAGRRPKIAERTVCYECQRRGFPCLLQRGEPCMGPITLGGCNAVCLQSRQPCWGCRGPYEGANFKSWFCLAEGYAGKKRVEEITEVFGVKDRIQKSRNQEIKK